jgi:hypothetical protein
MFGIQSLEVAPRRFGNETQRIIGRRELWQVRESREARALNRRQRLVVFGRAVLVTVEDAGVDLENGVLAKDACVVEFGLVRREVVALPDETPARRGPGDVVADALGVPGLTLEGNRVGLRGPHVEPEQVLPPRMIDARLLDEIVVAGVARCVRHRQHVEQRQPARIQTVQRDDVAGKIRARERIADGNERARRRARL